MVPDGRMENSKWWERKRKQQMKQKDFNKNEAKWSVLSSNFSARCNPQSHFIEWRRLDHHSPKRWRSTSYFVDFFVAYRPLSRARARHSRRLCDEPKTQHHARRKWIKVPTVPPTLKSQPTNLQAMRSQYTRVWLQSRVVAATTKNGTLLAATECRGIEPTGAPASIWGEPKNVCACVRQAKSNKQ